MNSAELSKTETTKLFALLHTALANGALSDARKIADEMCRSSRRGTCRDLVARVDTWPNLKAAPADFLQTIQDRIDQYNANAS